MRVGFVSDIHSNLHALKAILRRLENERLDHLVCLGDLVGYNADPVECVRLVRETCDVVLLGNHDWAATVGSADGFNALAAAGVEHSRRALEDAPEERTYLAKLSPQARLDLGGASFRLFHASPRAPLWEYVFPPQGLELFAELAAAPADVASAHAHADIVVLGHTHVPMLFASNDLRARGESRVSSKTAGGPVPGEPALDGERDERERYLSLDPDRAPPLALLNPGSVGQPRDADPRASCAIVETVSLDVKVLRVPYDVQRASRAVVDAGLPPLLGERLLLGR